MLKRRIMGIVSVVLAAVLGAAIHPSRALPDPIPDETARVAHDTKWD